MAALYSGRISDTIALGQDALKLADHGPESILGLSTLLDALVERGTPELAWSELCGRRLDAQLTPGWPETLLRYRRARVRAALLDHQGALDDLLEVGRLTTVWSAPNPAQIPWRSTAARSLLALDRADEARELAVAELDLAHRWGAPRTIGVAQCVAGMTRPGPAGEELLREAVATLEASPARLELARALAELGARLRRERRITESRTILRRALDLAHETGGFAVAEWARDELVSTGAKPRRPALHGRESLTPRELRVAELAASGLTNRQIAQALFITTRTVEHHLTSSYLKLNIRTRTQPPDTLQTGRSQAS